MVHEPRFTADLLASLLSIPPSKTLLRRHLNTHFKELLGRDCIQEKREAEATLGYIPLSATTKVKVSALRYIYSLQAEQVFFTSDVVAFLVSVTVYSC